jgi:hypothetical protein
MNDIGVSAFDEFWLFGYDRLCPIIPPEAPISPRSPFYKTMGKHDDPRGRAPGTRDAKGGWHVIPRNGRTSPDDCDRWRRMGAHVGVRTGDGLAAIDASALNGDCAEEIAETIEQALGVLPPARSVGQLPRALYLVRTTTDVESIPSMTMDFGGLDRDKRGRVEILSEGRCFAAWGTHPVTRQRWRWTPAIPLRDDLPLATYNQLACLMLWLQDTLPNAGPILQVEDCVTNIASLTAC